MVEGTIATLAEAKRSKVAELREELGRRGLDTSGTKEVLVERLRPHLQVRSPSRGRSTSKTRSSVSVSVSGVGAAGKEGSPQRSSSRGRRASPRVNGGSSSPSNASPKRNPTVIRSPGKATSANPIATTTTTSAPLSSSTPPNDNGKKKQRKKKKKKVIEKRVWAEPALTDGDELMQDVSVEYVSIAPELSETTPGFEEFSRIFARFAPSTEEDTAPADADKMEEDGVDTQVAAAEQDHAGSDDDDQLISKRQLKKKSQLSVAQLKQLVDRPDVVEWYDVSAADPRFLVYLKSYRNTVPVPGHWCSKKRYLSTRTGLARPAFELPDFIKETGIAQMRQAVKDKEDTQKLKTKARQQLQPKMGKLEIDYQKLHDAFFRFQTKPYMSIHGDLYAEGKEFEAKMREKRPGVLSTDLREALGITSSLVPPPWLLNMQRYGPPPSYPNLRIPGLNAPIPEGCQWGFHPGGWGKPPVDEFNRPLYGDVFGLYSKYQQQLQSSIDASSLTNPPVLEPWGELEPVVDEEEESEEESEAGMAGDEGGQQAGMMTPAGFATPSGLSSVATGLATPDVIELRKDVHTFREEPLEAASVVEEEKSLYTVIPQQDSQIRGMMGSEHVYNVAGAGKRRNELGTSEEEGLATGSAVAGGTQSMVSATPADLAGMTTEEIERTGTQTQIAKKRKLDERKKKEFKF